MDHRGDLNKVLEGMDEGIKYIDKQKKEFELTFKNRIKSLS